MKRLAPFLVAAGLAQPALADVDAAIDRHILPALDAFAVAAASLEDAAAGDCRPEAVTPAFHGAFDAWMAVADLRIGPSETGALSIAFWPDARGSTRRTLSQMIAGEDPVVFDPAGYAEVSIAARGLFALEMLLFDPAFSGYARGSYACALGQAISADLARQAKALEAAWREDFAATLRSAGEAGNAAYLDESEALRALYTQLLSGLDFTADQRLGRPMGDLGNPRPARAEARRSGRSLRNVLLSVDAAQALAHALADGAPPRTDAAADRIRDLARRISDPAFGDLDDPEARLRVEILQQAVRALRAALEAELGAPFGIAPGFNSQDGD